MPKGIDPGWEPLIHINGLEEGFHQCCNEMNERNIVRFLISDKNNPSSILSSLTAARENCRTVREIMPRSVWETLNEMYIFVKENMQKGLGKKGRDEYLEDIISRAQQLAGLIASEMYRDPAYHFMRIGRNLERADMTSRIIDVRSTDLFGDEEIESRSLDASQWISVLSSVSAYQIYRRHKRVRVQRSESLDLLIRDSQFPRSIMFSLLAVEESLCACRNDKLTLRSIRNLQRLLTSVSLEVLSQTDLHELIDNIQLEIIKIHQALEIGFFGKPS